MSPEANNHPGGEAGTRVGSLLWENLRVQAGPGTEGLLNFCALSASLASPRAHPDALTGESAAEGPAETRSHGFLAAQPL